MVAFFGRRSSLVFDLSPSKKVGLCLSLSLSRFSLARLCGAIERAERLNSIVDCGYKTLNLKYLPPPQKKRPSFVSADTWSQDSFIFPTKRNVVHDTMVRFDIAIKKTRSFLSSRDVEGGTNRNRATFHRSRRVFFAPRVSHKIVARLYGGKRRCGKDERCDRLGGVF